MICVVLFCFVSGYGYGGGEGWSLILGEFWRFWTRRKMGGDLVMMGYGDGVGVMMRGFLKGVFGRGFDDVVMTLNVGVCWLR